MSGRHGGGGRKKKVSKSPSKSPSEPAQPTRRSPRKKVRRTYTKAATAKAAAEKAAAENENPPAQHVVQVEVHGGGGAGVQGAAPAPAPAAAIVQEPMDIQQLSPPTIGDDETIAEVRLVQHPSPDPSSGPSSPKTPVKEVAGAKGKGRGKGKSNTKSKTKAQTQTKAKQEWSLTAQQEQEVVEWMAENESTWRRGSSGFKAQNELWEVKAQLLGVTKEYLLKWWKGIKDHFVKLHKTKSGQSAKKHTDREKWILTNCNFYKGKNHIFKIMYKSLCQI